jgi:hypothetical protein
MLMSSTSRVVPPGVDMMICGVRSGKGDILWKWLFEKTLCWLVLVNYFIDTMSMIDSIWARSSNVIRAIMSYK